MNLLFILILTSTVTVINSFPQKYSPVPYSTSQQNGKVQKPIYSVNPPRQPRKIETQQAKIAQGCRIENKTMHDVQYKDVIENKCEQKFKPECEEKSQRICKPYQDRVCKTDFERKCEVKYREKCENVDIYGEVEYQEEVCNEKLIRVCDKHWECIVPNLELKYCNDKVWVENPKSCQNLKKTECHPETKFKTVKKPTQKCGRVAYDDCKNVPYEICDLIAKQDCQNESFQDCKQVPYEHCENIHKQVPHQVTWQKSVVVCNDENQGGEVIEVVRDDANVEYEDDYDYPDFYDDLGNIPVKRINTRDARTGIIQGEEISSAESLLTGEKRRSHNSPIKKPKYSSGIVFPSDD